VDEDFSSWAGRDERVFTYLPVERELLSVLPRNSWILDLGCGDGSHMSILASGGTVVGADVSAHGLAEARLFGPVLICAGEQLPFRRGTFDFVYVSHVLHHAQDHRSVLSEIYRVLKSDGRFLLIETCEDSPLMRLARTIRPRWEEVPVRSRFRFRVLVEDILGVGFAVDRSEQFNVLYWIWGFARRKFRPLERLLPHVIRVELSAVQRLRRYSAYGFVVGRRPSSG